MTRISNKLISIFFLLHLIIAHRAFTEDQDLFDHSHKISCERIPQFPFGATPYPRVEDMVFQVTTDSNVAKEHFLLGVYFLYNFEPNQALFHFQRATADDTNFIMSYWGQIMSYKQLSEDFLTQPQINKIIDTIKEKRRTPESKITKKESLYIQAIEKLAIPIEKNNTTEQQIANSRYSSIMRIMHEQYPEDENIALFFLDSLSKINSTRDIDNITTIDTIIKNIYFTDTKSKISEGYATIAYNNPINSYKAKNIIENRKKNNNVGHLLQVSNYYFNVGDWDNFIKISQEAWQNSKKIVVERKLPNHMLSYISAINVIYGFLQINEIDSALSYLEEIESVTDVNNKCSSMMLNKAIMTFFNNVVIKKTIEDKIISKANSLPNDTILSILKSMLFIEKEDQISIQKTLIKINEEIAANTKKEQYIYYILKNQLLSVFYAHNKKYYQAINAAQNAVMIEDKTNNDMYIKKILKPSRELLGEILIKSNFNLDGRAYDDFRRNTISFPCRMITVFGMLLAAENMNVALNIETTQFLIKSIFKEEKKQKDIFELFQKYKQIIQ